MSEKIKVLVVDDSAIVREILSQGLSLDPKLEVVGTATDPYLARDKIMKLKPDVLTLDIEMPRMDGVNFLKRLMPQHPLPVVMVSSLTQKGKQITLAALAEGAVDFVTKPTSLQGGGLNVMLAELRAKVKIASKANVSHWKKRDRNGDKGIANRSLRAVSDRVIAIGASTGGPEAISQVVTRFPAEMPGVVIVQHMPPGFTSMFASRLNDNCAMQVKEAESGDRVQPGTVLIAPGGFQMTVRGASGNYRVICQEGEKVCGHCPSVEVLFQSIAKTVGKKGVGVMLTGMGRDGSEGMLQMRQAGAKTLVQDEATSVVFGMPRVAYERGAADVLVPIDKIANRVMKLLSEKN